MGEDELLWTGSVKGDLTGSFEYRYAVVDEDMNVVRWDALTHTANFSPLTTSPTTHAHGGGGGGEGKRVLSTVASSGNESASGEENGSGGASSKASSSRSSSSSGGFGDTVEIRDTWELQSHPENLFLRAAFRDVIIPPRVTDDDASHARPQTDTVSPSPRREDWRGVARQAVSSSALGMDDAGGAPVSVRLRLEVRTLRLVTGQRLHATGSCAALGGWDRDHAAAMVLDPESRTWHLVGGGAR